MIISKIRRKLKKWNVFAGPVNGSLMRKMGHSPREKLLIIHADDLGLSQSQNKATIQSMTEGIVNSASLMMPCRYAYEAIDMLKDHPELDIGLHLTLTCEWSEYKWGALSPASEVPSLLNEEGHMHPDCLTFLENAHPEEVEIEMRAQIQSCIRAGIMPSHLDSHMSCIFKGRPEYLVSYLKVGKEFGIPAMVRPEVLKSASNNLPHLFKDLEVGDLLTVDHVYIASEKQYELKGMNWIYSNLLKNLQPGINVLLIHPAFDDDEMKRITSGHRYWNAAWRQADYDFFMSQKSKNALHQYNIKLITWKEINEIKNSNKNTRSSTGI
ncbi:MAG: polysaccharide deacetylase family protein [Cyclobacteriaceae bacterium]